MAQDYELTETPDLIAARKAYDAAWNDLARDVADLAPLPYITAGKLTEIAEEYGAEHAVSRLHNKLSLVPEIDVDQLSQMTPERDAALTATIERFLDARDALDLKTRDLNERRTAAGLPQIVHFGGKPHAMDKDLMARSLANDEPELEIDLEPVPQREPTLSEQMRAVERVEKAEPRAPEPRTRAR